MRAEHLHKYLQESRKVVASAAAAEDMSTETRAGVAMEAATTDTEPPALLHWKKVEESIQVTF